MDTNDWLTKHAPGFANLSREEREGIAHFAFLWSLFEGRVLNAGGSPEKLVQLAKSMTEQGSVNLALFAGPLEHFRIRYWLDGRPTYLFDGLNFRRGDRRPLVESVLSGQTNSSDDIVSALLLIVYRLRNNLFHGMKWAYGIREQLANFQNANEVLMRVLERHAL
ncbi:hypothetical protein [Cupriavidus numazuensis]|uniref:Apea-like HEPN domain-containing protein n=1 Tax=Cupriavidus numazuensis TaxID=221992 RepID=A0ABM8TIC9_9BURK|nr:hypothetical protein [Cupriavidus numazuensis]CAG2148303.1 hypothetical protein LMG26411_03300 [Cupriavidus numazuensis]